MRVVVAARLAVAARSAYIVGCEALAVAAREKIKRS
jgi:hypothetical protein